MRKGGTFTKEFGMHDQFNDLYVICNDPRHKIWGNIKRKLMKQGDREKSTFIGLYGGPIPLAFPETLVDENRCLIKQIQFAIETFGVRRVIHVGHDCGYYKNILLATTVTMKKQDLEIVAKASRELFRHVETVAYFADGSGPNFNFEVIAGKILQVA